MADGTQGSGLGIQESGFRIRAGVVGFLAALPCIALAALSAWWSAGGLVGRGLWPPDKVTLAEAIATRNNAEALRLITVGADPNQPSGVRDGLLANGYDVNITPLEAAVGAQRADSLRMLLAHGAVVDEGEMRILRCYERTRPNAGVRETLDMRATGEPDCSGIRLPGDRVD